MHVHFGLLSVLRTLLELLLVLIPIKIVTANYVGRSTTAEALYGIL
jgi:hypothetical protein